MNFVGRKGARALLAVTGAILGLLVVLGLQRIGSTRDALVEAEAAKLSALADIRHAEIALVTDGYRQKADLVASRTRLRELLAEYNTGPTAESAAGMVRIIGDASASDALIAIIDIVDGRGRIVASTDEARIGEQVVPDGHLEAATADDDLRGIQIASDTSSLSLTVTAPMSTDAGLLGTALVTLTEVASRPLTQTTEFGESGEILVGFTVPDPETGADTSWFATPLRGQTDPRFLPVPVPGDPMLDAVAGVRGPADADVVDYAGESVIAVTRPLTLPGWGLVAKVDTDEVAGKLTPIRNGFLALGVALILFGAAVGVMVGRRFEDELLARDRAEAQFTSMFKSAPIALLLVDQTGVIRLANHTATALLGYQESVLCGMSVDRLVPDAVRGHHAELRSRFVADAVPRLMRVGQDVVAVAAGDREVPVEVSLTPIETDDGPMVVAALVDLSERKAAHGLLEERADVLERSNRDLDAFAYVASHDLKAPLRAIENLAGFVLEDAAEVLSSESIDDLTEIRRRSTLLKQLLNGLLEYARVGRKDAEPVGIDVAEMVAGLAELYVPADRFLLTIAPDLPPLTAPRAAVELVLRNLLMNSVAHHDGDRGAISVDGRVDGNFTCFVIGDDGPGIPESHREKVFELFKKGDRSGDQSADDSSTGIGLALIKRTIETHGGSVRIVPSEGRGIVFEIRWPLPQPRPAQTKTRRKARELTDVSS